jgi:hypothetical protein
MWARTTALLLGALWAGCVPSLDRPPPGGDLRVDSAGAGDRATSDSTIELCLDQRPLDLPADHAPSDLDTGRWYQLAKEGDCPAYCTGIGRANVGSPEQSRCMSGEVRPASGVAQGITFPNGCWGGCAPQPGPIVSASLGRYCYYPGQTKDADVTDITVGCFCK